MPQQGELSVAITGTDTLSPALQRVNQQLERSRIALGASGAVAKDYSQKLQALQAQYATGEIDAIKYDRALRRLDRTFQQTSADIQKYSNNTAAAVGATNQMVQATTHTERGLSRALFGVQALSAGIEGGRLSLQSFSGALFALGGSEVALVLSGLAAAWALIASNTEDAADAENHYMGLSRRRLEGRLATLTGPRSFPGAGTPLVTAEMFGGVPGAGALAALFGALANDRAEAGNTREESQIRAALAALGADEAGRRRSNAGGSRLSANDPRLLRGTNAGPRMGFLEADQGAALDARDKLARPFSAAIPLAEKFLDTIDRIPGKFDKVGAVMDRVGNALAAGFGAAIDGAAGGSQALQAFASATLSALSREAKGKAVFEAAEGFAALGRGLFLGDPKAFAAAGAHFKAAALYGGAAVVTGALAGGGASAAAGRAAPATGTVGGSGGPVTIIQFVTPDGRQVSQHVVETAGRQQRLGAPTRVSLNAVVVGGPIARAA